MELSVINNSGKDTGRSISLSSEVFGVEPNDHAIYLDVKRYLAAQRQGTHKSKERAEISGSTRKIKKQKGTGTARAGSIKSPVFRGGGRAFGPKPRNYTIKLNKKLRDVARKSALSYKAKEGAISVVEDFSYDQPKTKSYIEFLSALSLADKKSLFLVSEEEKNIVLSSRNITKAKVVFVDHVNTYDLLHADNLIISEKSVEKISNIFDN